MDVKDFSKYEKARILGARAIENEDLEKIKFDALKIAEVEFNSNILPISVNKPFPEKKEERLKRPKEVKISDDKVGSIETEEEEEIAKEGEIMELANPDDEIEEEVSEEAVSDEGV
jgi:DNA-directed RNA polymerase subunit K/omega